MPPTPTYRVQVRPDFDLAATAGIVDYLADLGVGQLYSAPLLAATPGSAHGYDVVDPTIVNPELGGRPALDALVATLRGRGLGLVVDIVPNHLGVARPEANPAWWSVLREGPASAYAGWFDIDWQRGPLLLPVLADDGPALDDLRVDGDELRYFEHRYPLAPGSGDGTPREVHERQHYRLVHWRRANSELTYRRFFAVAELAGVRQEDPAVFEATHAEVGRWIAAGLIDGVRVDHPDGLRDPAGYLRRLRALAPDAWLLVEKILEYGEELPADWPVDGTTGYEALREVCGVFVDPAGEPHFPAAESFAVLARDAKLAAATGLLRTELTRLTTLATHTGADARTPEAAEPTDLAGRAAAPGSVPDAPVGPPDLAPVPATATATPPALSDVHAQTVSNPGPGEIATALAYLAAYLPVYRTYLPAGREHLTAAVQAARAHHLDPVADLETRLADPKIELAQRFQQYTGAVMAKGVEDTAYYRWTRFVALNEVGGAPERFGVPLAEFHAANLARQRDWPTTMTTLSTHDTKRGEDVRARLAVLAECPDEWRLAFGEWSAATATLGDPDFAQLLWQTAVGVWPIERERLHGYVEKAAREQATWTTWDAPNLEVERVLHEVVDAMYDLPAVRDSLDAVAARLAPYGWSNSLGQKLVQLTMPGVPDTYQGTELWENSLVDPDNRRPVDFAARRELLTRLDAGWLPPVDPTGAAKLLVTSAALRLRRDRPELFTSYAPIEAGEHVVAFDRGGAVTVATRLPVALHRRGGFHEGETLPLAPGPWHDVITRRPVESLELRHLLDRYPVALLIRADTPTGDNAASTGSGDDV